MMERIGAFICLRNPFTTSPALPKSQHLKKEDHGYGHMTSWKLDGEDVETVTGVVSLGSKITAVTAAKKLR